MKTIAPIVFVENFSGKQFFSNLNLSNIIFMDFSYRVRIQNDTVNII